MNTYTGDPREVRASKVGEHMLDSLAGQLAAWMPMFVRVLHDMRVDTDQTGARNRLRGEHRFSNTVGSACGGVTVGYEIEREFEGGSETDVVELQLTVKFEGTSQRHVKG